MKKCNWTLPPLCCIWTLENYILCFNFNCLLVKKKKKCNLKPHYHMGTKALLHKTLRFRISKTQPLRLTIINSHTRKLNNSLYEYTHAQHKNNLFLSHEVQSTLRFPFLKNSFRFWLCKIQPLRPTIHTQLQRLQCFPPLPPFVFSSA